MRARVRRFRLVDFWMGPAALLAALLLILCATQAEAQTLTVLHAFTGQGDGAAPMSGLTMDRGGRLYGTTNGFAGFGGGGSVFKLGESRMRWVLGPLYNFSYDDTNGASPDSKVVFGPDGSLYGTTFSGGLSGCYLNEGCGVVFKLQPTPTACASVYCPWTETVLYRFTGGSDGANPVGDIAFDSAGNLYGATYYGGDPSCQQYGCGVVYKLTPSGSGWTQSIVHSFGPSDSGDGSVPFGGVFRDAQGNLYGITGYGGTANHGIVYQLHPSNGPWTENILYNFPYLGQFGRATGTVVADQAGNLYGSTAGDGDYGSRIFELSQGTWNYSEVWHFAGYLAASPDLTLDNQGNIYAAVGNSILEFKYTNGSWSFINLHGFNPDGSEGLGPNGGLIFDANGNIYGTCDGGGDLNSCYGDGCGTVWEITP